VIRMTTTQPFASLTDIIDEVAEVFSPADVDLICEELGVTPRTADWFSARWQAFAATASGLVVWLGQSAPEESYWLVVTDHNGVIHLETTFSATRLGVLAMMASARALVAA
jgi:hypothetical protein